MTTKMEQGTRMTDVTTVKGKGESPLFLAPPNLGTISFCFHHLKIMEKCLWRLQKGKNIPIFKTRGK